MFYVNIGQIFDEFIHKTILITNETSLKINTNKELISFIITDIDQL